MRSIFVLAALAILQTPFAVAQSTPACDGDIAIVRVSAVKPGAIQGFLSAVAAHRAWYRNHGLKDNVIVASRIMLLDAHTGAMNYSDSEVITYHVRPPSPQKTPEHDAAWDAYVKQYRDTSDIKTEYFTCLPKLVP
jgi:hypothetical protein